MVFHLRKILNYLRGAYKLNNGIMSDSNYNDIMPDDNWIVCPHCNSKYEVEEEDVSIEFCCYECGKVIPVEIWNLGGGSRDAPFDLSLNLKECDICGKTTTFQRMSEERVSNLNILEEHYRCAEGQVCHSCDNWVCDNCTDWSSSPPIVCIECS